MTDQFTDLEHPVDRETWEETWERETWIDFVEELDERERERRDRHNDQ